MTTRFATGMHVRWLLRRDVESVLAIDAESFNRRWGEVYLTTALHRRNCLGCVAECDGMVRGYAVYTVTRLAIRVERFAVAAEARRHGVGARLLDHLRGKLKSGRRWLFADVPESSLAGQLFLRSQGLRCTCVDDDRDDGQVFYCFTWRKR